MLHDELIQFLQSGLQAPDITRLTSVNYSYSSPITPNIHFQQCRDNLAERITLRVINRLRIAVTKLIQDIVQNQAKHLHPIESRDFLLLQHPALGDKFLLA